LTRSINSGTLPTAAHKNIPPQAWENFNTHRFERQADLPLWPFDLLNLASAAALLSPCLTKIRPT
jgi:hypothetical protein